MRNAIVIGSGFGGIALALRLQSMGVQTTVLERLPGPGGRAFQHQEDGYTFDMGPTVITVPHLLEELFALQPGGGRAALDAPDFPEAVRANLDGGFAEPGPHTREYVELVPLDPFYRICFDDGTHFDYGPDAAHTRQQIARLAPEDLAGYERFLKDARAIFERGFLELGYTYFGDPHTMLRIVPELLKLDAVRNLFAFTGKYFSNPKMRQVFSFETLLIGGSPLKAPALYAMIHFVEKTWGVHYAMGGTGALVRGLMRKFAELGGAVRYGAGVGRILTDSSGPGKPRARGVRLESGEELAADLVVSNADWANTYQKLLLPHERRINGDTRVRMTSHSMSLLVVYFGFRRAVPVDLAHHTIILGPRYEGLLRDIFDRKVLTTDFSQYLHVPTLTDPSLAPEGHHAAYTLVPVPNLERDLDWSLHGELLTERVLAFLDERGYLPGLREHLTYCRAVTPRYFEEVLDSHLGNAFGPEPTLRQSAYFRPHNRSEDVDGLYLVGAGTQPGAGVPAVVMSAKMTARVIAEDFAL